MVTLNKAKFQKQHTTSPKVLAVFFNNLIYHSQK